MSSRRQFLRWLAAAGVSTGAAATLTRLPGVSRRAAAEEAPTGEPPRQWVMVIDLKKCEGCTTIDKPAQCMEACKKEHFVPEGQNWMEVFEAEDEGGGTYFKPRPCMHCEKAPCADVCPVGATYYNEEGLVLINHDRCIGCRFCMAACPYGARSFNWDDPENPPGATFANYSPEYPVPHRRGTVEKCMFCAHRLHQGKLPACVEACPMQALWMGDLVEDVATNGTDVVRLSNLLHDNHAFRDKDDLGTRPRVYYLPGHGQDFGR